MPTLGLQVWSAVLGMLDMNCMGIKVGCPIKEYLDNVLGLDPASPGADAARADAGKLWELLPGVYDAFCDGGGFFSLQSVINHDCVHNGFDISFPPAFLSLGSANAAFVVPRRADCIAVLDPPSTLLIG